MGYPAPSGSATAIEGPGEGRKPDRPSKARTVIDERHKTAYLPPGLVSNA